jgi:hypothetical protein
MRSVALILIWFHACDAAFTMPVNSPSDAQGNFRGRSTEAVSLSDPWNELRSRTKYVDEDMIKDAIYRHSLNDKSVDGMHGTLVQKDIHLQHLLHESGLREKYKHIHFYAIFNDSMIDERTSADLYIVKAQKAPYEDVVFGISFELQRYAISNGRYVHVQDGEMDLAQQVRRPDLILVPYSCYMDSTDEYPAMPRVLVEIELHDRSGPKSDKWCREYFPLIPQLQALLFIKVYPRRESGGFGALAVLYRREHPGTSNVIVDDAVSFGTEYLSDEALSDIPHPILAKPIRKLPDVPVKPGVRLVRSPWKPRDRPFILIKARDIFHWKSIADQQTLLMPQLLADATKDCKLELWRLMAVLNTHIEP